MHLSSLCQTRLNLKTHTVSETENRTSCVTTLVRHDVGGGGSPVPWCTTQMWTKHKQFALCTFTSANFKLCCLHLSPFFDRSRCFWAKMTVFWPFFGTKSVIAQTPDAHSQRVLPKSGHGVHTSATHTKRERGLTVPETSAILPQSCLPEIRAVSRQGPPVYRRRWGRPLQGTDRSRPHASTRHAPGALQMPQVRPHCGGGCTKHTQSASVGRGPGGSGTQKFVRQKWPDQIFATVNFVFSHDGTFGLKGG